MNTKFIMIASAAFLAALGTGLNFLPNEIAQLAKIETTRPIQLILQLLGALYFAFAMLNWMAKGSLIGGIYNKPINTANFTHFTIGAITLIKLVSSNPNQPTGIWVLTVSYSIFSILFGILFYRHPTNKTSV